MGIICRRENARLLVIVRVSASGIIPSAQTKWLRSSMVEQLTLNQLVRGSDPLSSPNNALV